MKSKSVGVAKVAALVAVPLCLAVPLAKVGQQRRAEAASYELRRLCNGEGFSAEQLQEMLRQGADMNQPDGSGKTVLHRAVWYRAPTMKVLLDAGADINRPDSCGSTPLILAAKLGYSPGVRLLLSRGADVRPHAHHARGCERDSTGTALYYALRQQGPQGEIVQMLKAAGAKE